MKDTALKFGSLDLDQHAFFFDFDGTLAELVDHPDDVVLDAGLRGNLLRLSARTHGALAIITGRQRAEIVPHLGDTIPVAGLHGTDFPGDNAPVADQAARIDAIRALLPTLAELVATRPGTLLEDKGAGLALHWRAAPDAEAEMIAAADQALATLGAGWQLQPGKCVAEIRPAGDDKGGALRRFMATPLFRERLPVAFGDDLNDAPMLQAARDLGGIAVVMGDRDLPADIRMAGPADLALWLQERLGA